MIKLAHPQAEYDQYKGVLVISSKQIVGFVCPAYLQLTKANICRILDFAPDAFGEGVFATYTCKPTTQSGAEQALDTMVAQIKDKYDMKVERYSPPLL